MRTALLALLLTTGAIWADTLADAAAHENAGRIKEAIETYRSATAENPANGEAWDGLIRSLMEGYRRAEALAALDQALKAAPAHPYTRIAEARVRFRQSRFADADRLYNAALDSAAKPDALLGLARINALLSQQRTARGLLEQAYQLMPTAYRTAIERASSIEDSADHIAAMEDAIRLLDPATVTARLMREHLAGDKATGVGEIRKLESPYERAEVKLEPIRDGERNAGVAVQVRLNGKKAVRLLVDTATSGIFMKRSSAAKAGLKKLLYDGSLYLADTVEAGGVRFGRFPIKTHTDMRLDGSIGADVFGEFLVTLDLPNARIILEPHPEGKPTGPVDGKPMAGYFRVLRVASLLLVPTEVNGKAHGLFVVETGAQNASIATNFARLTSSLSGVSREIRTGDGRKLEIFDTKKIRMAFGGIADEFSGLVAWDRDSYSDAYGVEVSGTLGFPALSSYRMTIDYRNGAIRMSRD